MKRIALALSFLALGLTAGCQVPPTPSPTAIVSWGASPSCTTTSPCSAYVISRATCTTACPATTGTAYTQVGTVSGTTTTFSDNTVSAGSFGWIIQAQQGTCPTTSNPNAPCTSQPSPISNNGTPSVVSGPPAPPTAPTVTTTAEMVKPQIKPSQGTQVAAVSKVTVRIRQ